VEDIEGVAWPAPPSGATYVMRRIHELRRVPLREFSIEDMRIILSQKVGTAAIRALRVALLGYQISEVPEQAVCCGTSPVLRTEKSVRTVPAPVCGWK
jgi:hypothetical protein